MNLGCGRSLPYDINKKNMKFATLHCKIENGGNKHENSNYFRYTWKLLNMIML